MAKTSRSLRPARTRTDGRKSLLVYLHPEVIKELKKAALDEDRTAYEITEEAVSAWLAARKVSGKGKAE
jgi:hypothetical protein